MTKFWERHEQEMRKNRLLQAAAIVYARPMLSVDEPLAARIAVRRVLDLERELNAQLKENEERGI